MVRDIVAVYKKERLLLIDSSTIDIYEINRINIVVGGGHGQGTFRFPMKILYIMNNGKRHENIQPVGYILLKNISLIKNLRDSINLLNQSMTFNKQHIPPSNIYVIDDLVFFYHFVRERTFISSCVY